MKTLTNIYSYLFVVIFSILLLAACSVKKNNTTTSKEGDEPEYSFSQNFTSKYNTLYNSKLLLDDEVLAIAKAHKINYQVRQNVFDEPMAQGDAHQLMDSVVKKGYHIVNEKQKSKYVHEGHYNIARAHYLKGSYYTAIEFFNYLIKNSEEFPKYIPLSYAWRSRAMHQIGKHSDGTASIDSAFMFLDDNRETNTFLHAVKANSLIKQGQELQAIPYLEQAIELTKNRQDLYRWKFLLGQLYVQQGNKGLAWKYFDELSKSNVSFDMAFEASIQAAILQGSNYDNVDDAVRPLKRMLREGKNDGYQDQILHQIGMHYLNEGKDTLAVEYFNKALRQEKGNQYQATETYMTLADHYFDIQKYKESQLYYDSVANILPQDYTDVNRIRRKLTYMGQLNKIYEEISWQDTLLYLGALNAVGLDTMTSRYARENVNTRLREIERKKALEKLAKRGKLPTNTTSFSTNNLFTQTQGNNYSGNSFYFNNPDAMMLGNSEFKRRWGNRELKDNWRYASGPSTLGGQGSDVARTEDVKEQEEQFDQEAYFASEKSRYLDAVPRTQAAFDKTHQIIHDNMIVIGNIYRDYTRDNKEAALAFEAFLARYPNTEEGPYVYYSLYRMYDGIDQEKSLYYKNRLIALFPKTLHAQIALDPYYMDKVNRDKKVLDRVFEKMFASYVDGDYMAVLKEADRSLSGDYATEGIVAQIQYLRALAIGHVESVGSFAQALQDIVTRYPQDSLVTPLAKENVAYMEANAPQFANRSHALYLSDKDRIRFANEPNMTPWPSLVIDGDYRTSVALAVEKPKEEKAAVVEEEVKEIVVDKKEEIAAVEEKKKEALKEEEKVAGIETEKKEEVASVKEDKKEEVAEGTVIVEEEKEQRNELASLTRIEDNRSIGELSNKPLGTTIDRHDIAMPKTSLDFGPNDYRNKELFPEQATYYFVINVMDNAVNLAPSRYGIGQFNRSRYARASISHQLKPVNNQNQLVYVGPFTSYTAAKEYESRIRPMLLEIMKVPQENYNIFVITKELMDTLTDDIQIRHYREVYLEQP